MKSLKKNAVLNVIQNICKILFPLITIPYASRVLKADNYGKVSFSYSIIRYFIVFAALGIAVYAQREAPAFRDDKKKINRFANQVFTINVLSTLLSYLFLLILLSISYKLRNYRLLILLQSIAIILPTLGADWVNVVFEDYFFITIRYITMQCISLIMLFLFVRTPNDYYWYAMICIVATAGGNFFNILYIRRYVKLKFINPKECTQHLKSIILLFCVSITMTIYISSDITILGYFKTDADVGIYTMAANIYSVIKQIICAVITVSIPRLAYYLGNEKKKEYEQLGQRVLDTLLSILLPAISGLVFLSEYILNIMGGDEYNRGKSSLIVLAFALLFGILSSFYSNVFLLLKKKDKTYLLAAVLSATVNICLNLIFIPYFGIISAAITTLIAELIMTLIAASNAVKEYKLIVNMKIMSSSFIGAILVGIVCCIVGSLQLNSIFTIGISFVISIVIYYMILKIFKNPLAITVDGVIKKYLRIK